MYTVPLIIALLCVLMVGFGMYKISKYEKLKERLDKATILDFSKEMMEELNQIPKNITNEVFVEGLQTLVGGEIRLVKIERIKSTKNNSKKLGHSYFSREDGVRLYFDNGIKLACTMQKAELFLLELASQASPNVNLISIEGKESASLRVSLGQPPLDIVITVGVYHQS